MYDSGVARIQQTIKFSDMRRLAYILHPSIPDRLFIFDPSKKKVKNQTAIEERPIIGKELKSIMKGDDKRMV